MSYPVHRPRILITNDDGIQSPGLWIMAESLASWADVFIVAPDEEQSGMSISITIRKSLSIYHHPNKIVQGAWSVTGTPADCVKTALSIILDKSPDIIVSGINRGHNAGKNVLYSGTIGGAIEGALRGFQTIAFSSYNMQTPSFEIFAPYTSQFVQYALNNSADQGVVLNVNFPCPDVVSSLQIDRPFQGVKLVRQGKEYILEKPHILPSEEERKDHHKTEFHMGGHLVGSDINDEMTDIYWLKKGFVTCVPVFVEDLTHGDYLKKHAAKYEQLSSDICP